MTSQSAPTQDQDRDLEEGLLAMHEIDPSPVEDEEEDDFVLPAATGSSYPPSFKAPLVASPTAGTQQHPQPKRPNSLSPSSSALGLHGHSMVYYRMYHLNFNLCNLSLESVLLMPTCTRSTKLMLTGYPTVTRIQKYSSYTFTVFLTMHITNNAIIPLVTRSVAASEPYLLLTRPYYQSALTEPLVVVLPLLAHILSGMALRAYRRVHLARRYGADTRDDRRRFAWPKLSGTSILGYSLIPFVLGHVFVNRLLPLWVDGSSAGIGLSYVSHGFAKDPATSFIGYTALIALASTHIVWGWAKWLGYTPDQTTEQIGAYRARARKRRWYILNAISALLAGIWLAGGLGVVGRGGRVGGWVGRGYDELYRRIPVLGRWL